MILQTLLHHHHIHRLYFLESKLNFILKTNDFFTFTKIGSKISFFSPILSRIFVAISEIFDLISNGFTKLS